MYNIILIIDCVISYCDLLLEVDLDRINGEGCDELCLRVAIWSSIRLKQK